MGSTLGHFQTCQLFSLPRGKPLCLALRRMLRNWLAQLDQDRSLIWSNIVEPTCPDPGVGALLYDVQRYADFFVRRKVTAVFSWLIG